MTLLLHILWVSWGLLGLSLEAHGDPCAQTESISYTHSSAQEPWNLTATAKFLPALNKSMFTAQNAPLWLHYQIRLSGCQQEVFWQSPNLNKESLQFWQVKDGRVLSRESYQQGHSHQYFPYRHIPTFKVSSEFQGLHDIYVRVSSRHNIQTPQGLIGADERIYKELRHQVVFLLFMGLCLGLSMYNLYLYAALGDRSYIHYVAFVLLAALGSAMESGNLDWVAPWSESWQNWLHPIAALIVAARITCLQSLLPIKVLAPQLSMWLQRGVWIMIALAAIDLIPSAQVFSHTLIELAFVLIMPICIVTAVMAYMKSYRVARFMIFAWSVAGGFIALRLAFNLGLIPESFFVIHAFKFSIMAELALIAMVMANQINILQVDIDQLSQTLEKRVENRTKRLKETQKKQQENQAHIIEQEKFQALGRIADALSNEVNTPLMIIKTGAGIIERCAQSQPENIGKRISQIERAADKIETIIRSLTTTYLNPVSEDGKEVSVKNFIESIINLHRKHYKEVGVQLELDIQEDISIPGNPLHLGDIIGEIILGSINAVSPLSEKWIKIEVSRAKNDIIMKVKDSCTDTDNDERQSYLIEGKLIENIENSAKGSEGIGVAIKVIQSYGGTMKLIQNNFYTLTTIKFPIDVERELKRVA